VWAKIVITAKELDMTSTIWQKLSFSLVLKILGLLSAVVAAIVATNEPTSVWIQDPKFYMAVLLALNGFFSKSNSEHGTPSAPITPVAAEQIAAVAAALPAGSVSFVGEPFGPSFPTLFSAKPNDPTPDGTVVTSDPRGTFKKHIDGTTGYYMKTAEKT
jgi:hypothetical protein